MNQVDQAVADNLIERIDVVDEFKAGNEADQTVADYTNERVYVENERKAGKEPAFELEEVMLPNGLTQFPIVNQGRGARPGCGERARQRSSQ